jgi:undecaprenyl-diphosphatase
MGILDALILGILQGITEFLPISSSGHLVIAETFLGLKVETLKSFDVVVHLGTLSAIIIYFWKDVVGLFRGFFAFLGLYKNDIKVRDYQNLIKYIILASIPAVLVGLFLEDTIDFLFRDVFYVGLWMIIVAEVFLLAEFVSEKKSKFKSTTNLKKFHEINLSKAIIIGLAQAVALIPGVSRSGSTIAAGLFQGISREKSARFSFLLAMPVIFGAGLLTLLKGLKTDSFNVEFIPMLTGFVASLVSGFVAVYFLMKFLKKHSLKVFSIYLFVIGGGVVILNLI